MKKVKKTICKTIEIEIYEKGDLIMYFDKHTHKNCFMVVVEDQDPTKLDTAIVRDITDGFIYRINDVHTDNDVSSGCIFITHLSNMDINMNINRFWACA